MWSFRIFCYPNRLTWMLICSRLPRTQLRKKPNAAEPRACWRGCSYTCSAGDAALLQPGSNLSLGYKMSSHKGISFFHSAMLWPWQKKGQQLFSPLGGDNWRGHVGIFERKKPLGFLELGYCKVPWSLDGACQGIPECHPECGQVSVGDPALVGSKLKPPGTFLCHQLPAPTAPGRQVLQRQVGDPVALGEPSAWGWPCCTRALLCSPQTFLAPLWVLPCPFQGGKIAADGRGLGSNKTVCHVTSSSFKHLQHLFMEIRRFFHGHVGRRKATSLGGCWSWQSKLQSSWAGGGWPPGKPGGALICSGAGNEKGGKYWERQKQVGDGSNVEGVAGGKGSLLGGVSAQTVGCSAFGVSCRQICARAGTLSLGQGSELARGCQAVTVVPHWHLVRDIGAMGTCGKDPPTAHVHSQVHKPLEGQKARTNLIVGWHVLYKVLKLTVLTRRHSNRFKLN